MPQSLLVRLVERPRIRPSLNEPTPNPKQTLQRLRRYVGRTTDKSAPTHARTVAHIASLPKKSWMHTRNGSPIGAPNHFLQDALVLPVHQARRQGARVRLRPLLVQRASVKFVQASAMKALADMVKIASSYMTNRQIEANLHRQAEVLHLTVHTDQTLRLRFTHVLMTVAAAVVVVALQVPLPEPTTEATTILPKIAEDKAVNMADPIKTAIIGEAAPLAAETHID